MATMVNAIGLDIELLLYAQFVRQVYMDRRVPMNNLEEKEFALQTIMLLSALESWSFSNQVRLPDYLHEQLSDVVEHLSKKVLHE